MSGVPLVVTVCVAHALSLAGFGSFAALLPIFFTEWGLTNTEAGWISGIYFAGYASAVLVLVSLTDRVDPRRIYLACATVGAIASFGFAVLADGFWSALVLRTLAGLGLAGTYMPGLKVLTDRFEGPRQSRIVAFYTASFGIGVSLSVLMAGEIAAIFDWRAAFVVAGAGSLAALAIMAAAVHPMPPAPRAKGSRPHLLDFRPVLRNRPAMGYVLGYTAHCWELMGLRSWIVVFLVYSQSLQAPGATIWSATAIAALVNILGVPSSILGNEVAARFGRARALVAIMVGSALIAFAIGYGAALPYVFVVGLLLVYGITVTADSAALTAGAVASAGAHERGATMAVHSFGGFTTSALGPLAFGIVLDLAGGQTSGLAWGLAFGVLGLGVILGPVALTLLGRADRRAS